MKKMCLMVVAAVAACGLQADVKLAAPFNDGMVLQREKPVAVWGTAAAGEHGGERRARLRTARPDGELRIPADAPQVVVLLRDAGGPP